MLSELDKMLCDLLYEKYIMVPIDIHTTNTILVMLGNSQIKYKLNNIATIGINGTAGHLNAL